ncbi:macro domain-containing protein [Shewanella aestuarii]|uniref:Macro domain-containing protein n=1 Tax=Shewanella aestuarii TaxID=1028752 RepID=A0A6G9QHN8_9GAMM|nr:macro domain-containing protein [Shewanella aestuarii]QIR13577.1 hypothetical protein HBH39_02845 [Shewanella aestuarii]
MLDVIHDDIFSTEVDAIVNPANVSLLRGGGLCGVIHKRAGIELENECKTIGRQEYGDVVITPSFGLSNCKHIIHACGPRWLDGKRGEVEQLELVHQNIMHIAYDNGLTSIAIPAISTGIYRFPVDQAAQIAITAIARQQQTKPIHVYFVLNELDKFNVYQAYKNQISVNCL